MRRGTATASALRAPTRNASSSLLGPAPSAARYREALSAAWRARGRGIADEHTNACRLPSGKLSRVERGALEHARALICFLASIVLSDITCLRVTVPKTSFFAVRTCRRFESLTFHHTDSPTCVFPCPRALYDAMASHEASWWTAAAAACPRGLSSARPDAHRSVFFPHRSPACGVQCNRSSPRFERGAPNFAHALIFYPAIRVDSPTSPAVACSVRRQLSREITGARAHRSSVLSLAVLSYGWLRVLCFFASFSHLYHAESGLFPEFTSGGLQRPQTTFPSCW